MLSWSRNFKQRTFSSQYISFHAPKGPIVRCLVFYFFFRTHFLHVDFCTMEQQKTIPELGTV